MQMIILFEHKNTMKRNGMKWISLLGVIALYIALGGSTN